MNEHMAQHQPSRPAAAQPPVHVAGQAQSAAQGLLAAAAELCGGDAWLVRCGPEGGLAVLARSRESGAEADAVMLQALSGALARGRGPGVFRVPGHADGYLPLAGAAADDPSGGLVVVVGRTQPDRDPAPTVLRALEGLAAAAAALAVGAAIVPAMTAGGDLLQTVIDAVPDHIWVKDPAGRYVVMNRAAAAAFGLGSPAQAIGRSARDVLPSPRREISEAEDAGVIASGEPLRGILRQGTVTGSERWWFANKMPLKDSSGRVIGLVGISRDVSDLEAARADLARERDRLQQILEAIPDAVFVKDREGRIILHNQSAADRLAPALGERVLGASVADYYSGERLRRARDEDREVIDSGRALLNQLHHATDGSRDRWTLVSKAPLRGPGKVVEGLVGVSRDITALHLAERALEAERAQLQIILDSLPVSVYLKDASGRYLRINRAAAARLGLADPGDAIGKTAADL